MSTHRCPGGCGAAVPAHLFACRSCWYRLPYDRREAIWTAYRAADRAAHQDAMADATAWYRANPRPTEVTP